MAEHTQHSQDNKVYYGTLILVNKRLNVYGRVDSLEAGKQGGNSMPKEHHKVTHTRPAITLGDLQTLCHLFSLSHQATATVTDRWKATLEGTWE